MNDRFKIQDENSITKKYCKEIYSFFYKEMKRAEKSNDYSLLKEKVGKLTLNALWLDTPKETATFLLKANRRNRRITDQHLYTLQDAMLRNEFKQATADPIRIANTGLLLDGQNRLTAIKNTGKTQRLLYIFGMTEDMINYLDKTRARTGPDTLDIHKYPDSASLSAIAKLAFMAEKTGRLYFGKSSGRKKKSQSMVLPPDNAQLLDFVQNDPALEICTALTKGSYTILGVGRAPLGAFYYAINKIDPEGMYDFATKLNGINVPENHIIKHLRDKYTKLKNNTMVPIRQKSIYAKIYYAALAWSKIRNGKEFSKVNTIKLPRGLKNNEPVTIKHIIELLK